MSFAIEDIAKTLGEGRKSKGLSQRALSTLSGVPQSHISKIEAGEVDLRLSSLIELARALDMELTLVPRNTVPAVQSIIRAAKPAASPDSAATIKACGELARLQDAIDRKSWNPGWKDQVEQFQRVARDLQHWPLTLDQLQTVRDAYKELNKPGNQRAIQDAAKTLQQLRNHLAHRRPVDNAPVRPAYTLDEDDNG